MGWHEDFGDEPSVEERMPHGLSTVEMLALFEEASMDACEGCGQSFPEGALSTTDMFECVTMDLDPGTQLCGECYEVCRRRHIPDDPRMFDGFTPVEIGIH